jgi:hypothetical protein
MDAFAAAMAKLFNDSNLSVAAVYTPAGGGASIPLRVILAQPGRDLPGMGALTASAAELTADILTADVPDRPKRGALLETAQASYRVGEARADGRGLRWRMVLSNV